MKKSLLITLLLLFSSTAFSQGSEFEYIFDTVNNETQNILFSDILELSNGDYALIGQNLRSRSIKTLCRFSASGNMIVEKYFPNEEDGYYDYTNQFLKEDQNGNLYLFRSFNPILDTTNISYVAGTFDSKIVINKLDENFEITSTKEIAVPIDTVDWQTLWGGGIMSSSDSPFISLGTILELEGEGFVLSFEKFIGENPRHLWEHGHDSTFFWKMDYDGNILKTGFLAHSKCNNRRHKDHLVYDKGENRYYYYTSAWWEQGAKIGFYIYHFDSDFNYLGEYLMANTQGVGIPTMYLRDELSEDNGITLKRTSSHTTIVGASIHYAKTLTPCDGALCMEFDDEAHIIDSIQGGVYDGGKYTTSVPSGCSLDWIDENRIFFGYTPLAYWSYYFAMLGQGYQYFILRMLDRNLNIKDEVYYNMKKDSTFLWINTIKATSDGGCMIAGHFYDFVKHPVYDGGNHQSVVKKFPPETFLGIEEAHENGVSVAVAYPNPGKDMLCIRTTVAEAEVEVFDVNGRIVAKRQISDLETLIPSGSWSSGMYLWRVSSKGKVVESGKWVK